MSLTAAIVAVGDELLAGATVDTNSAWLGGELERLGFRNRRTFVVGDDEPEMIGAVRAALDLADVVLVTGGLGPTEDDRTRDGVAAVLGLGLAHSEEAWAQVTAWYARRGVEIPASNRRQALMPDGARVLENPVGTAPGFRLSSDGRDVFVLPGPPREMRAVFDGGVRSSLAARAERAGASTFVYRLQMLGLSESVFADSVGDWMARDAEPLLGCTVSEGVLSATLRGRGTDPAEVRAGVEARAAELRERFREHVFREGPVHGGDGADGPGAPIQAALGRLLIERSCSITAAESCTAGLALARLASVPGISAVLSQGFVTYSNDAKVELLGVAPETLANHGAVSPETAAEMALGAARRAGARAAFAVSGIAGPGGGTEEKPVGTVAFATALDGEVRAETRRLPPTSRDLIRATAANVALVLLWRRLNGVGETP